MKFLLILGLVSCVGASLTTAQVQLADNTGSSIFAMRYNNVDKLQIDNLIAPGGGTSTHDVSNFLAQVDARVTTLETNFTDLLAMHQDLYNSVHTGLDALHAAASTNAVNIANNDQDITSLSSNVQANEVAHRANNDKIRRNSISTNALHAALHAAVSTNVVNIAGNDGAIGDNLQKLSANAVSAANALQQAKEDLSANVASAHGKIDDSETGLLKAHERASTNAVNIAGNDADISSNTATLAAHAT